MHLIGLCGKAGAGKSTFASELCNHYYELTGKLTIIIPFAKALKDLAISMGWDGVKDKKGRRLLQLLGTDVCRECINDNYWIDKWLEQVYKSQAEDVGLIVADDVRFQNEIDNIMDRNGSIYKLTGRAYDMDKKALTHKSEQEIEMAEEFVIDNSTTILSLNLNALTIIRELTGIKD